MKTIPLALTAAFALLMSWGMYEITQSSAIEWTMAIVTFIAVAICLGIALCVKIKDYPRSTQVIRAVSIFVNSLLLIANLFFALLAISNTPVILTNGIILLIYLIAIYSVSQSKQ